MNIVAAVLFPAVAAGVCWFTSRRLWRSAQAQDSGHWGGALAFAFGYIAAHVVLSDWPPFPPNTAAQWLVYLTGFAGLTAAFEGTWGRSASRAWRVRAAMSGLFAYVLLRAMIRYNWSAVQAVLWIGAVVLVTTIVSGAVEALARRRPGPQLPIAFWLVCAVTSAAQVMSGSALLGQLTGALAAVFGAAAVLSFWRPSLSLERGAVSMFVLLHAALLWQGVFYSELHVVSAAFLMIAPVAAWLPELRVFNPKTPFRAALLRLAATAAPLTVAFGITLADWLYAPFEEYYY